MKSITVFANEQCAFCKRVMNALRASSVVVEFVVVPMARELRSGTRYDGARDDVKGLTFGQIFDQDLSIPKAIVDGKKLFDSAQILEWLEESE